ncbi:hypothetical protein E6P97_00490, partial [Patescibacteria group bacterium]
MDRRLNTGNRPTLPEGRDSRSVYARAITVPQVRPEKPVVEIAKPAVEASFHPFEGAVTSPVTLTVAAHASALHGVGDSKATNQRAPRTASVYAPVDIPGPTGQVDTKNHRIVAKPASSTHHRIKTARRVVDSFSYGIIAQDQQ